MKALKAALLLVCAALALSGCGISAEVENQAYALILGVDRLNGGKLELTARIPRGGSGAVPCRVVEETETPFTYVVAFVPEGAAGTTPVCMELSRADWLAVRGERLAVAFPPEKLLWLRT